VEVASAGPYASLHLTPDTECGVLACLLLRVVPDKGPLNGCVCVYNAVIFSAVGFYSSHPNPTCKTALQILKIHIGIKPYREIMAVMIEACCW